MSYFVGMPKIGWFNLGGSGPTPPTATYQSGIVAYAAGGQTSATPLTALENRVDTVAAPLASVLAIQAQAGGQQNVLNNGANTMNLYPFPGDAFLNMAVNKPIPVAAGGAINLFCYNNGIWTY
jgi:hypothetical protein